MSKLRKKLEARKDNRRYQETRFILEVIDFLGDQDNDLTPAQAEALDRATARPPVKIKCRDLPSRKRK